MFKKKKSLIKILLGFSLLIFFIMQCLNFGLLDSASYAVTISVIIGCLYEKYLWRYNILEKTPALHKKYECKIKYVYKGISGEKIADVNIHQTLFDISIKLKTNEETSISKSAQIVEENGQYFLYYVYITEPKNEFADKNPIKYGYAKISLSNVDKLEGQYWTTHFTKGDMIFTKK